MDVAGGDSPNLAEGERRQARQHAPLRAVVIHEIIRAEGETELARPVGAMFWSGLAAGLSMGFSFAGQALLQAAMPHGAGGRAVAAFGYALGFIIVVLGRQQLFTESTLTAILPVLTRRDLKTALLAVRLWNVVFVANIAGTWIFATLLVFGHPLPADAAPALSELAGKSVSHPFWHTLLRAVFAGWLIALMVWLLPSARSLRLFVVLVLSWAVALCDFSHIIAGSTEAAYAVLTGQADWTRYMLNFLVPTLIGNTIGGVSLVGMLNHAPVAGEVAGDDLGALGD